MKYSPTATTIYPEPCYYNALHHVIILGYNMFNRNTICSASEKFGDDQISQL